MVLFSVGGAGWRDPRLALRCVLLVVDSAEGHCRARAFSACNGTIATGQGKDCGGGDG